MINVRGQNENDAVRISAGENQTSGSVSVNTSAGGYIAPATRDKLGVIKVGNNLDITKDGTLSANTYSREEITTALNNKADVSSIPKKVSELTNDAGYITSADIPSELEVFVTSQELEAELTNYVTSSALTTELSDYVTTTELSNELSDYVTSEDVTSELSNYDTKTEVNTKLSNYVSSSQLATELTNYVTSSALTTELSDYVTTTELSNELSDYVTSEDVTSELSNYDTKTEVNTKLSNYVSSSQLATELTNYVTSSALTTELSDYVTTTDLNRELRDYVTETELDNELANFHPSIGIASASTLGGVKIGSGLQISQDGTISVNTSSGSSRNIGEIVTSTIPLTDSGLHLLDGSLIQGNGIYADFVDYISDLYTSTTVTGYESNVVKTGNLSDNASVLSNFSPTDYATLPNVFAPEANPWEMVFKINVPDITVRYDHAAVTPINRGVALFVHLGKLGFSIGQDTTWVATDVMGNTTLSQNTDYYAKLEFTGTAYKSYLSTDGINYNLEATYTTSVTIPSFNLAVGVDRGLLAGFSGSVDLKESYININGQRWWTGAEEKRQYFCSENKWQNLVSDCGSCGKFVYDAVNNTVRLPKISCLAESTTNAEELGNINSYSYSTGSSKIYSAKSFYYITVATSSKTDVQIDIDQVTTDLNGKADTDLSNVSMSQSLKNQIISWGLPNWGNCIQMNLPEYPLSSTTTSFVAPSDGWCNLSGVRKTSGNTLFVYVNNNLVALWEAYNGFSCSIFFPVSKNDVVFAHTNSDYSTWQLNIRNFYPMKGAG